MINRVVWENLRHRPVRTALTVAAIALEVCMILLLWGLADGLVEESARRKKGIGAHLLIRPSTSDSPLTSGTAGMSAHYIDLIAALPEVEVTVGSTFKMLGDLTTVTGVEWDKFERMAGGIRFPQGGPFEDPFDIVVDETYAAQKNLALGHTIRTLNRDFRLVGITESGKLSRLFIPLTTMQELMGWEGKLSQIYIRLKDPQQTGQMIQRLKEMLPKHPVYSMEEFISLFEAQTRGLTGEFMGVIVGIAISVGFIVVLLSMYTAVVDRTREIGILKALGASRGYIINIFMREALLMTLGGVLVGIGLAYLGKGIIDNRFPLVAILFLNSHLIWSMAIAVAASFLGALYPTARAAGQDAIDALAYE